MLSLGGAVVPRPPPFLLFIEKQEDSVERLFFMSKYSEKRAEFPLPPVDPTQPTVDVPINGDIYRLCFDTLALAAAEEQMVKEGNDIILLVELPRMTIRSTLISFTAAARKYQPWLTYQDVVELLTPPNFIAAANGIYECWEKCKAPTEKPVEGAKADEENPSVPS
jgi:hypothetical protein